MPHLTHNEEYMDPATNWKQRLRYRVFSMLLEPALWYGWILSKIFDAEIEIFYGLD